MAIGNFFKSLFKQSSDNNPDAQQQEVIAGSESYKGFTIEAAPVKESGQYRTAGYISKEIDGVMKKSRFIRADNSTDKDQAVSHTLSKGRQIIDEQGERLFEREMV